MQGRTGCTPQPQPPTCTSRAGTPRTGRRWAPSSLHCRRTGRLRRSSAQSASRLDTTRTFPPPPSPAGTRPLDTPHTAQAPHTA
eukprot:3938227-Rhodomonas_salina.2